MKINDLEFLCVSTDPFGKWGVSYYRNDTRCFRPITDTEGKAIRLPSKPIGWHLLDTVEGIVGSKLTQAQVTAVFDLPIRG